MKNAIVIIVSIILEVILISLSIPGIEIGIIPFIALLPSIFIIKYTRRYSGAFFLGWLVGVATLFVGFNWLTYTIDTFSGKAFADWLAYPIFILFCIVFSLKFPITHLFVKIVDKNTRIPILVSFPLILTGVEFVIITIGGELFPFFFGNLMYKDIFAMQIAEFTGVSGLTFIMGLSSALIFTIIAYFFPRFTKTKRMKSSFPYLSVAIAFFIILGIHLFGYLRILTIKDIEKELDDIKIGFIQPNTTMPTEDFKNSPSYKDKKEDDTNITYFRRKCLQLTLEILRKEPDVKLIIWPESSLPNFIFKDPKTANEIKYKTAIQDLVIGNVLNTKNNGIYLYISDYDYDIKEDENGKQEELVYNNTDLISPDGELVDSYRKIYLLAFGEYNPFRGTIFENIIPKGTSMANFTQGKEIKTLKFGKWRFAPQICYEIIIPYFTRLFANLDADFIINTTNDRWFGISRASQQHLILGIPRTIENRMYMIRTSNSGVSAVISATGEFVPFKSKNDDNTILNGVFEQDYMVANIKPININTFYKLYGDIFGYIVAFASAIMILASIIYRIVILIKEKAVNNSSV